MDSIFEANPVSGVAPPNPAILFSLQNENARLPQITSPQQLLFAVSPRQVCNELGLNWWAAARLHEDGWLSFPPEATPRLDETQEAELRFIGAMVVAGCDRSMLAALLADLEKPYSYDLNKVYFDWHSRKWRALPQPEENPEAAFAEWLEVLVERGDTGTLSGIEELAKDAVASVRARNPQKKLTL